MGITANTWVEVRPAAWTWDVLIDTQDDLKTIHVECLLEGSETANDTNGWTAEITEYKSGKAAAAGKFGAPFVKDELRRVAMDLTIPDAKLWSPESPFLYMMTIRNASGEVVGAQRFGVRTFVSKDGNFLLNGKTVMLRGICEGGPLPGGRGQLYAAAVNEGGIMHRYYQMFKDMKEINCIDLLSMKNFLN
jgi:beta-galactosidase/beta-glucuronidase